MLFTVISTALIAFRLKKLLLKERSERTALQTRVEELEERCANAAQQLEQQRSHEAQYKGALHSLQESVSQQEALRASQQVEEVIFLQKLYKAVSVWRNFDSTMWFLI